MNFFQNNKKEFYSFLLLFTIIPLLLIPGLSNLYNPFWKLFIGVIFIVGVAIIFGYALYEMLNITTNKSIITKTMNSENQKKIIEQKNHFFIIIFFIGIIYLLPYFFFSIQFLYEGVKINPLPIFIYLSISFLIVNSFLLLFPEIDLKDQFVISIFASLLFLFSFGIVYLTIFYSFATIFLVTLMTSFSDMGAFFIGRKIGKRKIIPHISPNKTMEGFMGGAAISLLFGIIWYFIFMYPPFANSYMLETIVIWKGLLIIFVIILMAPFGDLFSSKIKRTYQIKDFGKIIPGHGGLLDRIDSHIFTVTMTLLILMV